MLRDLHVRDTGRIEVMPSDENKLHHERLRRMRGKASTHECIACGGPGYDWAYQYSDPSPLTDQSGAVYSLNMDHYAPMCRKCHKHLDHKMNPHWAIEFERVRHKLTPEDRRKGGKAAPHLGRPLTSTEARTMGRAGGAKRGQRMREDPDLRARMAELAVANLPRGTRECLDCGMVSSAAGMGNHLKASGHSGYRKG